MCSEAFVTLRLPGVANTTESQAKRTSRGLHMSNTKTIQHHFVLMTKGVVF